MNAVLAEAFVGMFLAALTGSFALGFATSEDAARSVARIRARRDLFRFGGFAVTAGIVFMVQADAIVALAGVAEHDPRFLGTRAAGWSITLAGVALLDAVLWWPGLSGTRAAADPA